MNIDDIEITNDRFKISFLFASLIFSVILISTQPIDGRHSLF